MSIIKIDEELNKSEEVADFLLFLINENTLSLPKLSIPQILMAKLRPGLVAEIITSSIVSRFEEAGIPTGPLADGAPNVMEAFVKVFVEEFVDAIHNDLRIDLVTDPGATISAMGANAGGPVASVGATVAPHTGIGIAR